MTVDFTRFGYVFPPSDIAPLDPEALSRSVATTFGVPVPQALTAFWAHFGAGYFGAQELYFFGVGDSDDALIPWNRAPFWPSVYPAPHEGGPLFFAETCFGAQLGFRYEREFCFIVLFVPDTFEAFRVAHSPEELFQSVLLDPGALEDPNHLRSVRARHGLLPRGFHYAPVVSPLVGGSDAPDNFMPLPRRVHLVTAIAEHEALASSRARAT